MQQLKIGVHLPSLRQPLKKALHTASRLGADGVEIDARADLKPGDLSQTAARELRKLLDELNLRVAAISFVTRRGYDVLEELDARVEATKAAMRMAHTLGAAVVVNHVGNLAGEAESMSWQTLQAVLTDLGSYGHHVGATLAAKTGGQSAEDVARLVRALPDGCLGIDLDPGALVMSGYSPLEVIEKVPAPILHVRGRDGLRDRLAAAGEETPLGRGGVDFPALLGALEDRAYRGYLTVERRQASDPSREIGYAIEYLRNLAT